eukprot:TRINITY_DN6111_c0_g1_i9.p2 TRINITY_DN6111_c0_g1~~TRINITY_DN6111_c0_g1_i9.p2  ORF type:complete len:122 (+),score=10.87 TRINITY_DN6111_c0_g1_i9:132-497(+)
MIRRPPRSTQGVSSAASDVYKRQNFLLVNWDITTLGFVFYAHIIKYERFAKIQEVNETIFHRLVHPNVFQLLFGCFGNAEEVTILMWMPELVNSLIETTRNNVYKLYKTAAPSRILQSAIK